MRIGYFYWGYLGDKKYDINGNLVSTPDGNAFYSWSIIRGFQEASHKVKILCDRDYIGYKKKGADLFKSFATEERNSAYLNSDKIPVTAKNINLDNLDLILLEWRWNIPGRNDNDTMINHPNIFQPDQKKMYEIIHSANKKNIPIIVFDLDYKLTIDDVKVNQLKYIIELGTKWQHEKSLKDLNCKAITVQIPFGFDKINEKRIKLVGFTSDVIYIGNRYERDWCIDKYLPDDSVIHGNWLEPGHGDPINEWPNLEFRKRLSASEICKSYQESIATALLAKKSYCQYHFMTARLIEAIFYGTVPFFIKEYGRKTIKKYAGDYSKFLTIRNKKQFKKKVELLKADPCLRADIIKYLRNHLQFMDSQYFVDNIMKLVQLHEIQ